MKYLVLTLVFAAGFAAAHLTGSIGAADSKAPPPPVQTSVPPNPNIDPDGFLKNAADAMKHREAHRLSEEDFIKMSKEDGVIVLDARSKKMYDLLHIKGAINLNFSDIDVVSIAQVLPSKDAKILIYCNNNFTAAPDVKNPGRPAKSDPRVERAMRPKSAPASLNLSTQAALYQYGYRNVYELGPLVDPAKTKIELVETKK